MSEKKQKGMNIKKFVFPILVLIAVVFVSLKFSELKTMGELFKQADWWWLALALTAVFMNYVSVGLCYKFILNILDYPFRLFKLIKSTVVILFLNQAVPSLSFAGNIFFLNLLRKHDIKEGQGLMAIMLEFICYYTDFLLLIAFGFVYLFIRGTISRLEIIAVSLFVAIFITIVVMFRFWLLSKRHSKKRLSWFLGKVNYFGIERWKEEGAAELFVDEFRQAGKIAVRKKNQMVVPLFFQLGKFLFDCLAIYFVFLAFNASLGAAAIITGYIMARLFGIVSFLPGGIGAVEGGLVLMYTSFGVSLEVAFAVAMVFRALSFWLPLPAGLAIYRHLDKD